MLLQSVPERRRVRGDGDLHPHDGPAVERPPCGVALPRGAQIPGAGRVLAADVEVRGLATVPYEERAPTLQHPVQVDDRRAVANAVAGLQDEAARRACGPAGRVVGDRHLEIRSRPVTVESAEIPVG